MAHPNIRRYLAIGTIILLATTPSVVESHVDCPNPLLPCACVQPCPVTDPVNESDLSQTNNQAQQFLDQTTSANQTLGDAGGHPTPAAAADLAALGSKLRAYVSATMSQIPAAPQSLFPDPNAETTMSPAQRRQTVAAARNQRRNLVLAALAQANAILANAPKANSDLTTLAGAIAAPDANADLAMSAALANTARSQSGVVEMLMALRAMIKSGTKLDGYGTD